MLGHLFLVEKVMSLECVQERKEVASGFSARQEQRRAMYEAHQGKDDVMTRSSF